MVACANPSSSNDFGPVFLARGSDEAATWPVLKQPNSASSGPPYVQLPVPSGASDPELRVTTVDGQTMLVLAYEVTASNGPKVLVQTAAVPPDSSGGSLPQRLHWTAPALLTPAGLSSIDRWSLAVRGSELALSYLAGTPTAAGTVWDAYLTMTPNVVTVPVIWKTMVNNPTMPMSTTAPQEGKDDFIGVAIGPDGTPWASYFSPCSADPHAQTDPAREGAYLDGHPVNNAIQGGNDRGLVGSLLLPRR
jgi:hypothetical protein